MFASEKKLNHVRENFGQCRESWEQDSDKLPHKLMENLRPSRTNGGHILDKLGQTETHFEHKLNKPEKVGNKCRTK